MEKAKIRPLPTPNPLNRSSQKLVGAITSWVAPSDCLLLGATYKCTYLPGMQNFVVIGSGVSALQIRDFAVPFDVTSFHVRFFGGSSIRLQSTRLNGFFTQICQTTSFRVRKCLLRVMMTIFNILTLIFQKNRHFEDQFWLDLVVCGRKLL